MPKSYGLAAILYPLTSLESWYASVAASPGCGVAWRDPTLLHVTVVNCTAPNARSVEQEREVLGQLSSFESKAAMILPAVTGLITAFNLEFAPPKVSGQTVILPSLPNEGLASLKSALQGTSMTIPEDRVSEALLNPSCLGVDKFSTQTAGPSSRVLPTAAVTLGDVMEGAVRSGALPALGAAPSLRVVGVSLVFYRRRSLANSVVSRCLRFGSPSAEIAGCLHEFFRAIGTP